ncbi:MAG: glycosyl transferase [Candidatus Ryanbacteria bacterium CG10_big_fil_rev_8_21_14_0_10_43_42]|uniref:Glycosyl transferase n=1 Tax=Candidatus Ryanbacteria bacterium CG10_big_fil_rev_8_21_14_0_10_43_42 TaxID=1974864 RepID=A0A2M8KXD8_9BACT|nr:MAG: glycosyl transferase [Candidatus Ryanbacteria bacterium CG10_big_fil_rev_8_21_14_0_10_43_42]
MNKQEHINYFDTIAPKRDEWKKRNWYYHKALVDLMRFIIPEESTVLDIGSGTGDLLASVKPKRGVGVDISPHMIEIAGRKYPTLEWRRDDAEALSLNEKFDYVMLSDTIGHVEDIERVFHNLPNVTHSETRIIITHINYFWEPMMWLAEVLHLKARQPLQNWISPHDVESMLHLAGFEIVKQGRRMIMPVWIPLLSVFCNRVLAHLPLLSRLGIIQYVVARPAPKDRKEYSVSIIIPARNEKGNIERALVEMPAFGLSQEIIFVEGGSIDGTLLEIKRVADAYAEKYTVRYAEQNGTGKGDAVRKGFSMATGEMLMILDADLTVRPKDLPKFYEALATGRGEFINGSRLVYPLEKESMRFLNILGNKFFSIMFSWLLGQRIKDTLCGTKVLLKKDYERIAANRSYFGDFDPFGDFDLIFGSAKLNLKMVEIPIRYQARTYGSTNIQRWKHGLILLRMVVFAMRKIKFL